MSGRNRRSNLRFVTGETVKQWRHAAEHPQPRLCGGYLVIRASTAREHQVDSILFVYLAPSFHYSEDVLAWLQCAHKQKIRHPGGRHRDSFEFLTRRQWYGHHSFG